MFAASVVAALLALPFTSVVATDCARQYVVQPGDYCDLISAKNNASTYQLAVSNIGKIDEKCDNLQPGQELCLGFVGQDCTNTYVVQGGDTCLGVAANHGINATVLNLFNPQLDAVCDNLYIGEVVCVGGGSAEVPPLPSGVPMPAATIPAGAAPAAPTKVASLPSSTPVPSSTPAPAPPSNDDDDEDCDDEDDDEDEDDLPFCDEL